MLGPPEEQGGAGDASWKDSYKTAQMVALPDVTRVCGTHGGQLVQDLAQGAGCPEEYVLMPLIVCCSALMGPRTIVHVHSAWSEPPVLWIVVGARAGSRKSAALRQVLMPLLTVTDATRQQQRQRQQAQVFPRTADRHLPGDGELPAVYTGTLSFLQLRALVEEGAGSVLHVTERVEDSHRRLGIHPSHGDHAARSQLKDLYEALPGDITARGPHDTSKDSSHSSVSRQCSAHFTPPSLRPQVVCLNHCGFAEPEYVVNMVVKSPSWLSARFLVSCPSVPDHAPTSFSIPREADDEEHNMSPERSHKGDRKRLTLKDLYCNIAKTHSQDTCTYIFSQDAMRELQRFQEEEWCTIVTQLGREEQGGVVSKSLGHIVRLAAVLKALTVAAQSAAGETGPELADLGVKKSGDGTNIEIDVEDVSRAIELGKYFLEQKLSMTFMVSTGFFRNSMSSSQNQHQQRQQHQSDHCASSRSMGQMLPPLLPGQAGQGPMTSSPYGLQLGMPPMHIGQNTMGMSAGAASHSTPTSNPLPQHQQPFYSGYGGSSAHALHSRNAPPSQPVTSTPSSAPSVDIDVTQLPATWAPTTPEEELAEMSQAAEFVQLEPTQFVAVHARRVKRLLECFDDGCGVSATTAAQKSIAPPVRVAGTNNRHPAWASALFFQKVADLGLGSAEQVRHPTNGRVYWRFKRKPVAELTEKNYQLLQYLRVDTVRYSRMGHPALQVPGLEADAPSPAGSLGDTMGTGGASMATDEVASNSSSKGERSPVSLESPIKQEIL